MAGVPHEKALIMATSHVLAHLVLALAAAQLLHGLSEVFSARIKVARLSA